jgi:hypothetical protein
MLCCAMLCYAVFSYAMVCWAVLCRTMLCCAMLMTCALPRCGVLRYITLVNDVLCSLCYAVLCCAMLCYAVLCCAALLTSVLCGVMPCCTAVPWPSLPQDAQAADRARGFMSMKVVGRRAVSGGQQPSPLLAEAVALTSIKVAERGTLFHTPGDSGRKLASHRLFDSLCSQSAGCAASEAGHDRVAIGCAAPAEPWQDRHVRPSRRATSRASVGDTCHGIRHTYGPRYSADVQL